MLNGCVPLYMLNVLPAKIKNNFLLMFCLFILQKNCVHHDPK